MSVATGIYNNVFTWRIEGELDLTAGAAVSAIRGDNLSAAKTGTGQYTITLKNSGALQLVELLDREANFSGATRPATALGVCMDAVTQSTTTGDITIVLTTLALPTSGAATDGTAAVTISFGLTIRIGKVNSPI
jgi:hypothetical protein